MNAFSSSAHRGSLPGQLLELLIGWLSLWAYEVLADLHALLVADDGGGRPSCQFACATTPLLPSLMQLIRFAETATLQLYLDNILAVLFLPQTYQTSQGSALIPIKLIIWPDAEKSKIFSAAHSYHLLRLVGFLCLSFFHKLKPFWMQQEAGGGVGGGEAVEDQLPCFASIYQGLLSYA